MKIHTTQDLNSLVQLNQLSTNNVSSKDFRLKNYSEQMLMPKLSAESAGFNGSTVSFKQKAPAVKSGKKIISAVNKKVGNIKREANPDKKRGDKLLTSSLFNKTLDLVEFETVVTATVAAIACAGRAGTIMALPTKKNKEDNRYAASHAVASGIIGFITAFILTAPFKVGSNYVMKNMKKNLNEATLKRLYPHIDLKSINDSNGVRKAIDQWKDRKGNSFVDEMKACDMLPELRNLADVSEQTFKKILIPDKSVNWAAQEGKSFNDVVLTNGQKLYDVIDMSNLGVKIEEKGMNKAQIMLKDMDKNYLEELIKDAKGKSHWGDLDINSVYEGDQVIDFRKWKDVNGKQWKLNLDEIGVSSPYETADYKPRISGKKRLDQKDNIYKYSSYQKNGKDGRLGTEIENDMVKADAANDGLFKSLTWGPDLLFRVPVAATTIALIPWVLNNIFNVRKSSASKNPNKTEVDKAAKIADNNENSKNQQTTFKGKADSTEGYLKRHFNKFVDKATKFFGKPFGKFYGKPLIENEKVHKTSAWLSRLPGNVTQHMTAFGSLITSGVYMQQTLTKKDLDPDRRRTLAINQGLCFVVPTLAAYTVDRLINNWVKNKGYRLAGLTQREIDIAKLEKKDVKEIEAEIKNLSKKTKGIRTLSSITIFALIYRYLTPVFMTPAANWFGDKLNAMLAEKRAAKKATAIEIPINENQTAKEISINNKEIKQSA